MARWVVYYQETDGKFEPWVGNRWLTRSAPVEFSTRKEASKLAETLQERHAVRTRVKRLDLAVLGA